MPRKKLLLLSAMAVWMLAAGANAADPAVSGLVHNWQSVLYAPIECPWKSQIVVPFLRVPDRDELDGLQFRLEFEGRPFASKIPLRPRDNDVEAKLHLPNGHVIAPQKVDRIVWSSRGPGMTGVFQSTFPWQDNNLDEAWIELRLTGMVHWLEIPYGFSRDPHAQLPRKDLSRNEPQFAPAMQQLNATDDKHRIVSWQSVKYTTNQFTLLQSNPFDASCVVLLHGVNDLYQPLSSVEFIEQAENGMEGRKTGLSLITPVGSQSGRSDSFSFRKNPGEGRDWGSLRVTIGQDSHVILIPSSLYRYAHGTAMKRTEDRHDVGLRRRESVETSDYDISVGEEE